LRTRSPRLAGPSTPARRSIRPRRSIPTITASRIAWRSRHGSPRAPERPRARRGGERAIAATAPDANDDLLEYEVQRADIALQRGEWTTAEAAARRAIARSEALGSTREPGELRSWLITDRQIPYEVLFAALARQGDAAGALAVFQRYQGLSVLAGLVHSEDQTAPGGAFPAAELARLLPALSAAPLAAPVPDDKLMAAVRSAPLLVLVVAREEVWRIAGDHGQLEVTRVGALSTLRPQLDRLRAVPGDRAVAAALGALLVPSELARRTDQVLRVVLDARLPALPIAALRVGGGRLVAARPLVRSLRPSDVGCVDLPASPRRVIALDADGELARRISGIWPGATRASLFDVARGDLLQLGVWTEPSPLGAAAVLGNERISAL
jgi:hypothetical protein